MTDTIAELRALLAKATGGPWDHLEGMGIVRALRGDVAIPLFETRTPWHDPQHGAPTVRLAGEVVFRANSEGAKTSEALGREWNNAALVAAALNALPALLDWVEAGEKALRMAKDLLDTIEQTPGNVWHVVADDPETAVGDTYSAVDAALQQKADAP
jgi:hypothetical protein